ncbi:MAG: carboxypeptidase regulatory-like domain-containing protein [Acidobacteria bacterium]|nr:carboxypeptidase regulatory-like domain-containing protein [Acidobacteriota bacterium]
MFFRILCCSLLSLSLITAQETRSTLLGRATDAQGATVAGVKVIVRNTDTGASQTLETNPSGYYEANLLMPGPYQITAESKGFKKVNRTGIILPVSSRIEVNLSLEIGALTETISVSAEAPLLETNSVSSGRVIDNKTLMELPVMGNSAMLLVKNSPGIQTGGVNNYLALHSNAGGSDYSVGGNIGGNSWTLDGSPNQGPSRRTAYMPYTDLHALHRRHQRVQSRNQQLRRLHRPILRRGDHNDLQIRLQRIPRHRNLATLAAALAGHSLLRQAKLLPQHQRRRSRRQQSPGRPHPQHRQTTHRPLQQLGRFRRWPRHHSQNLRRPQQALLVLHLQRLQRRQG